MNKMVHIFQLHNKVFNFIYKNNGFFFILCLTFNSHCNDNTLAKKILQFKGEIKFHANLQYFLTYTFIYVNICMHLNAYLIKTQQKNVMNANWKYQKRFICPFFFIIFFLCFVSPSLFFYDRCCYCPFYCRTGEYKKKNEKCFFFANV